jgi:hypothetical protein
LLLASKFQATSSEIVVVKLTVGVPTSQIQRLVIAASMLKEPALVTEI